MDGAHQAAGVIAHPAVQIAGMGKGVFICRKQAGKQLQADCRQQAHHHQGAHRIVSRLLVFTHLTGQIALDLRRTLHKLAKASRIAAP